MKNNNTDLVFFLVLVFLTVLQIGYYYFQLPENVASHFNWQGKADNWSSKNLFMLVNLGVLALISTIFLGIRFFLPGTPEKWVNMPNKEYWLEPGRKKETLNALARSTTWFGCATMGLFMASLYLAFQANMTSNPILGDAIKYLLILYLAYTVVWVIRLILRFRKPA